MTTLKETKSILAKLLASENITISHQNVKTSYFNLKDRVLVCPIWKEMDGNLYDLLLGHEIAHALYTPAVGWRDAIYKTPDGQVMPPEFKDILNVLEDARIEKKVKRKYPGLSKSFFLAYKNLNELNFFGIKEVEDINELNLIDKINLHCKLGTNVSLQFNSAELEIIQEVESLETWDQVVELAWKLFQMQESSGIKVGEASVETVYIFDPDAEETGEVVIEHGPSKSQSSDDGSSSNSDSKNNEEKPAAPEPEKASLGIILQKQEVAADGGSSSSSSFASSVVGSMTDRSFREKEKQLISDSGEIYILTLPEENLNNIILNNDDVISDLERFIRKQVITRYDILSRDAVKNFNSRNKKVIYNILKEFNLKKAAAEYVRTQISKTGELDMTKLYRYKFVNNIFRKMETHQKGKSHGIVMFVDFSGSMQNIFRNTIEQMLILVSFCRLAQIPFDVYGFSNGYYRSESLHKIKGSHQFESDSSTELFIHNPDFHLKHLISSNLKAKEYKKAFAALAVTCNEYNNPDSSTQFDWTDAGIALYGTPFVETLLASRTIIRKFKEQTKVDIVNVIYLTDGEGNIGTMHYPRHINPDKDTIYFVDKKTQTKVKKSFNQYSEQEALTELVRSATDCKHIGFYLCRVQYMKDILYFISTNNSMPEKERTALQKCIKNNNYFAYPNIGYDKYFYIKSSTSNVQDRDLEIDSVMDIEAITNKFNHYQKSKKNNRVLLSKIAEEIASGLS